MEIPLRLVEDHDLLVNRGDGLVVIVGENTFGLVIVCPQCGCIIGGPHVYNKNTQSLTPSLVHNKDLGGCGWHGFLTNGIFRDA